MSSSVLASNQASTDAKTIEDVVELARAWHAILVRHSTFQENDNTMPAEVIPARSRFLVKASVVELCRKATVHFHSVRITSTLIREWYLL